MEDVTPKVLGKNLALGNQNRSVFPGVWCLVLVYRTQIKNIMCDDKRKGQGFEGDLCGENNFCSHTIYK